MTKFSFATLSLLILVSILVPTGIVTAQSTSVDGPVYIVQEDDYLADIANRFHVSQQELQSANGISNPNQITVGERLVIPGLEGIQGVLTTENVAFGESLQSLSLRYHIPIKTLERLNHLTSPNELYTGYSLVILQNDNPISAGKRSVLGPGQSLLELAVLNDTDPWALLSSNQLQNSSQVIPGDVVRIPGEEDAGPGALLPSITSVKISPLVQGQTVEIQIAGSDALSLSGSLAGHALNFFKEADNHYVALQGLHSKIEPGLYPVDISITDGGGAQFSFSQMALITPGDYYLETVPNVDPKTLDPAITEPEDQLWTQLFSPVSPEKLWEGAFALPVDPAFAGCYSSWYGARRSYNGSPYNYVHTGQDFCSQVGDPIYAAADGIVVYTGSLIVRGNSTMIDHGWGVFSAYLHQSEILVEVGDKVAAGQLIGRAGNTGRVGGPHLHFEVIVGGVQIDPLEWLNKVYP